MELDYGNLFDPDLTTQTVLKIQNKLTKSKARASLPDILTIKKVNEGYGVYAKCSFTQIAQFGPLEAPLVKKNETGESKILLKLDITKCKRLENADASYVYFDITNENMCNWMMFVEPARTVSEQNLCAHQEEDFIYYTTTRKIDPDEELKVWYSPSYAKFLSMPMLTPASGPGFISKPNNTSIAGRKTKTAIRMQVYLDTSVTERDVRSVPPKKRGWRRSTKEKRPYTNEASVLLSYSAPKRSAHRIIQKVTKSFKCSECGKDFKNREKLRIHSVVHSQIRNFLCHVCGASFKRKDKLNEHVMNVHGDSAPKSRKVMKEADLDSYAFKCTQCKVGFLRRGMFINHLIKRHPGVQMSSFSELNLPIFQTVRDYLCPYCEKVYKSSTKRKNHILNKHPGCLPPMGMNELKKNINDQSRETVISKECIAVTPECCPHCTRQYTTKHKLRKHMREKHPEAEAKKSATVNQTSTQYPANDNISTFVNSTTLPFKKGYQIPGYQNQDCLMQIYSGQQDDLNPSTNDLLTQAMTALEPPASEQQNFTSTYQESPSAKMDSYSRYTGSRKYMLLRSYGNSQNNATSSVDPKITPCISGKPASFKARALNNEQLQKQVTLPEPIRYEPTTITELTLPTHSVPQSYGTVHHDQQSLDTILGTDPGNEIPMLGSTTSSSEVSMLNDHRKSHHVLQAQFNTDEPNLGATELGNVYQAQPTSNWMYQ